MTSVVQLRHWLKEASLTERATTAAVVAVVVALVAVALVPAPRVRRDAIGRPVAADDTGSGPGTVSLSTGAASAAVGTGAAGTTGRGRGDGRSTVTEPRGNGSGAPLSGAVSTGRLTASDRGVSADAIRVGFAVADLALANQYGVNPRFRTDVAEAIDAYVDYANDRGGVLGRRVEPVTVSPRLADAADERQKCLELTETKAVFAVIDSFAFSFETSTACITAEHKTLLVNGNPGSSQNVRLGFPYQVSLYKDDNRKMKDLVAAARGAGFFDPAKGFKKLGILEDACSPTIYDSPTDGLKAHLRAAGVTDWSEFRVDCDPSAVQRGAAEAVLQFKQDGVTHVLLAAHPPLAEGYLKAAGAARYYPGYFTGDYLNLIVGGRVRDYEPNGFDGALGVTQTHAGEGVIGKPLPPLARTCSEILVDHGLPPVRSDPPEDISDDIEVLELCESFLVFLQVATAAGPKLTRSSWVDALAGVGVFRGASTDLARFDRGGKMTGGDTTKLVQWNRSCTCWKELTDFGPAAG